MIRPRRSTWSALALAVVSLCLFSGCRASDSRSESVSSSWTDAFRQIVEASPNDVTAGHRRVVTLEIAEVDPRVRDDVVDAARHVMASDASIDFVEPDTQAALERVIEERSAPRALDGAPRSGRIRPAAERVVVDAARDGDRWIGAVELVHVETGIVRSRRRVAVDAPRTGARLRSVPGLQLQGIASRIDETYWDDRVAQRGWIRVFEEFEARRDDAARDDFGTRSALDRAFRAWCARRAAADDYAAWRSAERSYSRGFPREEALP